MRALITGGAGFIGSHLADRFLQQGYEVRILDNLEPRVHPHGLPNYLSKEIEVVEGDVRSYDTWVKVLDDVDVISHQAAYQDYMLDFSKFLTTNTVSTALLYEVLVKQRIFPKKVIIASSQAVYGEGQYSCAEHGRFSPQHRSAEQLRSASWEICCPVCHQEATPELLDEESTNPVNQYAVSKLSGEQIGIGLGRLHGIPTVALRYSITQGPRQSLFNQYSGIMRIFFTRAMAKLPLVIYEDGLQTRDFVHVDDVVDANFCVLNTDAADSRSFNVGGGRKTTVLEFAQQLGQFLREDSGQDLEIELPRQYRVGDNRHSISNIQRLGRLGWKPKRELAQNLRDFLGWIRQIGGIPKEIPDAYGIMQSSGVVQRTL
jgi:dTDP-L-rhamnose 4-epimerase